MTPIGTEVIAEKVGEAAAGRIRTEPVYILVMFMSLGFLGWYLVFHQPSMFQDILTNCHQQRKDDRDELKQQRVEDRKAISDSFGELKAAIKENTETTRRLIESRRDEQRLLNRRDSSTSSPN